MIAEFITALPTIISLLEKEDTVSPLPPSLLSDVITNLGGQPVSQDPGPFVPTPSIIPKLKEFEYDLPIEFDPWWLKTEYKGIEPIPVPPKKKDCNPYWENCMLKV